MYRKDGVTIDEVVPFDETSMKAVFEQNEDYLRNVVKDYFNY